MGRSVAVLSAVISAACFGSLAVLATLAYEFGAQPLQLLAWRFGLASGLMALYLAVREASSLKLDRHELVSVARMSLTGYGAASICFFFALKYADAAVVGILLYTYPAMVVLYQHFSGRDRAHMGRLVAVVVTFIGCALVADPFDAAGGVRPAGILLGLGAAACYALFSALSDTWLTSGRSRATLMTYVFAFAGILAAVAAVGTGSRLTPTGWEPGTWLLLAAVIVFPTFIAVLLYLAAVRRLGASQAALISTFEPLFTIVFAGIVLGERLSGVQWLGAVLVLAGVLIAEAGARIFDQAAV